MPELKPEPAIILSSILSAALLVCAEVVFTVSGVDAIALIFRSIIPAAIFGLILAVSIKLLRRRVSWWTLLPAALATAPLSVWCGRHLAETATISRLLPGKPTVILSTVVMIMLLTGAIGLLLRLQQRPPRSVKSVLVRSLGGLLSTIGCLWFARGNTDLHLPLSATMAIMAFLSLQMVWATLAQWMPPLRRVSGKVVILIIAGFVLASGAAMVRPLSLHGSFQAGERTVIAGIFVPVGRYESLDDLAATSDGKGRLSKVADERKKRASRLTLPVAPGQTIILITADALRADHLSSFGYHRKTSPFIDALAEKAVVFEQAYSSTATSCFSIPSILTGTHMQHTIMMRTALRPTLADILETRGYRTTAIYSEEMFSVGRSRMARVKQTKMGFQSMKYNVDEAHEDVENFKTLVKSTARSKRPVFGWIHLYDTHAPYACHDKAFGTKPMDCYDSEIKNIDDAIGKLVTWVDEQFKDPIIVLTSDHGEAFGEHGKEFHTSDIFDEQVHVPLMIRVPGVAPRRVETPVSNIQVADTLLALTQPEAPWSPLDLRPYMVDADFPGTPVFMSMWKKKGLRVGRYKLVCSEMPKGPCDLFDLKTDPGEKKSVSEKERPRLLEMFRILQEELRQQAAEARSDEALPVVLFRMGKTRGRQELMRLAEVDQSRNGVEAIRLLALEKRSTNKRIFVEAVTSRNIGKATWSCVGLAFLGKPCDGDILWKQIKGATELAKYSAVALALGGDERAVPYLEKALAGADPRMRREIEQALAALE